MAERSYRVGHRPVQRDLVTDQLVEAVHSLQSLLLRLLLHPELVSLPVIPGPRAAPVTLRLEVARVAGAEELRFVPRIGLVLPGTAQRLGLDVVQSVELLRPVLAEVFLVADQQTNQAEDCQQGELDHSTSPELDNSHDDSSPHSVRAILLQCSEMKRNTASETTFNISSRPLPWPC